MNTALVRLSVWWVILGMTLWGPGLPVAQAQLADQDPVLHAGVEALVTQDPEVRDNPELVAACWQVAEATILDPRERAAVIGETVAMRAEGVDPASLIPPEVRSAAQGRFNEWYGQLSAELNRVRQSDPARARELEFQITEGQRQMDAFAKGERYVPPPEVVERARQQFEQWREDAIGRGMPREMVAMAERMFTQWEVPSMGRPDYGPSTRGGEGWRGRDVPYDTGAARRFAEQLRLDPKLNLNDPGVLRQLVDSGKLTEDQLRALLQGGQTDVRFGEGIRTVLGENPMPLGMGWGEGRGGPSPMARMPEGWHYNEQGKLMVMQSDGKSVPWTREMGSLPIGLDPRAGAEGWRAGPYDAGAGKQFAKDLGLGDDLNLNNPDVLRDLVNSGKITTADLEKMWVGGDVRLREGITALGGLPRSGGGEPTDEDGDGYVLVGDAMVPVSELRGRTYPGGGQTTYPGGDTGYTRGWEHAYPGGEQPQGWARNERGDWYFVGGGGQGGGPVGPDPRATGTGWDPAAHSGTTWEAGSNWGINPSTGGWEPNMGGTTYTGGGTTYSGTSWESGSNWGINPSTGGWEPNMGGTGTTYTGGGTTYSGGEPTYTGTGPGWESGTPTYSGTTYYDSYRGTYDAAQETQHGCSGLSAEDKAVHQAHGHCPNE